MLPFQLAASQVVDKESRLAIMEISGQVLAWYWLCGAALFLLLRVLRTGWSDTRHICRRLRQVPPLPRERLDRDAQVLGEGAIWRRSMFIVKVLLKSFVPAAPVSTPADRAENSLRAAFLQLANTSLSNDLSSLDAAALW